MHITSARDALRLLDVRSRHVLVSWEGVRVGLSGRVRQGVVPGQRIPVTNFQESVKKKSGERDCGRSGEPSRTGP